MDWLEAIIALNEWLWGHMALIMGVAALIDFAFYSIILLILWRKRVRH